jgi:hypothetical protein
MAAHRIECVLAVLAVFCVLSIFLFPGVEGPYPVVHGPVTALLSIRAAGVLRSRIVRAGIGALRDRLHRPGAALMRFSWIPLSAADFEVQGLAAGCSSILRC